MGANPLQLNHLHIVKVKSQGCNPLFLKHQSHAVSFLVSLFLMIQNTEINWFCSPAITGPKSSILPPINIYHRNSMILSTETQIQKLPEK